MMGSTHQFWEGNMKIQKFIIFFLLLILIGCEGRSLPVLEIGFVDC